MTHIETKRSGSFILAALLAAGGLLGGGAPPAAGDDRDLLRLSTAKPYVFILFDTSGSMHWSPRCTQEQVDGFPGNPPGCNPATDNDPSNDCIENPRPPECDFLCPTGDCYTPLQSDDPASKFYQAKDALYTVLKDIEDVDFGFATFNQDGLHLRAKHWLYRAESGSPSIPGFGTFPVLGSDHVFGLQWACDTGGGDNNIGCYGDQPADLDDAWEHDRIRRLPKGGIDFNQTRTFYVRHPDASGNTRRYRVTFTRVSGSLGDDTIVVQVDPDRCTDATCSTVDQEPPLANVTFRKISDFDAWDFGASRVAQQGGYFSQGEASDSPASDTCNGWDPNTDSNPDDLHNNYSIRWPTVQAADPALRPFLNRGDVLPLDWAGDNKQAILERLAPNVVLGEATPDFRVARYFQNTPSNGHLLLANAAARPLVAFGSTPLGASVQAFRTWYTGCASGNCPNLTGWRDLASARDPDWGCRRKFLLVLTDGDETCGGETAACNSTASLLSQEGVGTYVVAFGVPSATGNTLTCMAVNGGTDAPIFPQNKQQLIAALSTIFDEIAEQARSFASAAVPSVQAEVSDKIYLTSFTPLNDAAVWPGRVDAFLKPLPTDEVTGLPDRSVTCSTTVRSRCHAWDAGEALLAQAPTQAEVDAGTFKLGNDPLERRVFYGQGRAAVDPADSVDAVPRRKRLFLLPEDSEVRIWEDLWTGLGVPFDPADTVPAKTETRDIIRFTLRQKEDTIDHPDGTTEDITYILGDIFHANPVVVSSPNRFRYFTTDLYGNGSSCTDSTTPNRGYRCFFERHRWRRKLLLIGSNEGQLHAFHAGLFDGAVHDGVVEGEFDDGGGQELFSFMPRIVLPKVRQLAQTTKQDWTVDGTMVVDDVFIDPTHLGTPTAEEREWRTVAVGGLREGGSGYYALDITQPDKFEPGPLAGGFFLPESGAAYVPSCLSAYSTAECGPLQFPTELWEFIDAEIADEDLNGSADLGESWSIPNSGLLRVIEAGEQVDKFVAVFGGGMDPAKSDLAGDWLYIVDIETGKPIYKRQLVGSAPSEPAAVDTDQNGYLDTIYIGTTAGFMYKVDVSVPAVVETIDILGTTVRRITDAAWEPFPIFSTGGRPIYFPPAVVFVAKLGRFALGFGTGDREDLWSTTGQAGRFYLILDQGFTPTTVGLPFDETSYQAIPAVGGEDTGRNFLLDPDPSLRPGWHIDLGTEERIITKAFSLSGVTIFTAYIPENVIDEGEEEEEDEPTGPICSKTGQSRIFVVFTDSANAVLTLEGEKTRYWLVPEFVTDPFTELSATKNPPSASNPGPHADELSDELKEVMNTLKGLFPDNCKFANYTLNVKTVRSDTGVVFIAPVPICIVEKNWKDI
jgi:hypothetical protein